MIPSPALRCSTRTPKPDGTKRPSIRWMRPSSFPLLTSRCNTRWAALAKASYSVRTLSMNCAASFVGIRALSLGFAFAFFAFSRGGRVYVAGMTESGGGDGFVASPTQPGVQRGSRPYVPASSGSTATLSSSRSPLSSPVAPQPFANSVYAAPACASSAASGSGPSGAATSAINGVSDRAAGG